ncbi:Uncharacterised protein [Bordetella pertussis]|nr:Uncharacterised protein [Bordetella pertussis]
MRMLCAMPAGSHIPRVGGATQIPASACTVITPSIAYSSCARRWRWRGTCSPSR